MLGSTVSIVKVVAITGSLEQSLKAFQDNLTRQHFSTVWNLLSHDLIFPPHGCSPTQSCTHLQFHCRCMMKMMRDLFCVTQSKILLYEHETSMKKITTTHLLLFQSTYHTGEVGAFVGLLEGLAVGLSVVGCKYKGKL